MSLITYEGQIQLYEIQKHISSFLLQNNPNTLISSSYSSYVIVIWTKSKSSSLYEPIQRITLEEETGRYIIVLISQNKAEEEFASCSYYDGSIILWRRGKGEGEFKVKQKIAKLKYVLTQTNELIFPSCSYPFLIRTWSPSPSTSSSSSDFKKKQNIKIQSSGIWSLYQINETRNNVKTNKWV